MGLIGDIYWGFRGDGTQLQKDAQKEGAKAGEGLAKSSIASFKKSWSGADVGKGFVQGLGLAGGLGAVTLVSNAIGMLGDIVGDSIKAFNEDQVSVQKLGTALRANVPNWDGNTDAIERAIKARVKLGFSDDEQRDGLATIATSTHDVTKALELEAGAMDIARAKNVDLATASDAVAKAYGGNTKSLKSLIPGLNLGKSSSEALANAFKAVGGAAEDFAKTDLGKAQVSAAEVGEAMEKLGSVLAGPVADGALAAADAITTVLDALDAMPGEVKSNEDPLANLGNLLHDLFKKPEEDPRTFLGALGTGLDQLNNNVGDAAAGINDFWTFWDSHSNLAVRQSKRTFDSMSADVAGFRKKEQADLEAAQTALGATADSSQDLTKHVHDDLAKQQGYVQDSAGEWVKLGSASAKARSGIASDAGTIRKSWKDVRDDITTYANDLINQAFTPIITQDRLVASNAEVSAQKRIIASAKASAAEKRDAKSTLDSTMQDVAESLVILAKTGQTNSAAFKTGLANLKTYAAGTKGAVHTALAGAIAEIEKLSTIKVDPITIHIRVPTPTVAYTSTGPHITNAGWRIYERGGVVPGSGPQPAIVHGGERVLNVRDRMAFDALTGALRATSGGYSAGGSLGGPSGGGDTFINVQMEGLPVHVETPYEVSQQLRRITSMGLIERRPSRGVTERTR